jgi:8-oxo-dGTP pyrophosphatase MutT (NUDIX family)
MLFIEKPEDFNQKYDVVGCLFEYNGKILVMLRDKEETHGNTWGLPSGRAEKGEELIDALKREIYEETGMQINHDELMFVEKFYLRHNHADLVYHLFYLKLDKEPEIVLDPSEHQRFVWLTPEDACKIENAIEDLESTIRAYYK